MKFRNLLFGMAIAATMLVALGAKAQPVNLTCMYIQGEGMGDGVRVTFDESAGTAVFGDNLVSKAVFTDATIKWDFNHHTDDYDNSKSYWLNRDTGTLTTSSTYNGRMNGNSKKESDRTFVATYKCTVAQKQF
jgi:hypothetical protein